MPLGNALLSAGLALYGALEITTRGWISGNAYKRRKPGARPRRPSVFWCCALFAMAAAMAVFAVLPRVSRPFFAVLGRVLDWI